MSATIVQIPPTVTGKDAPAAPAAEAKPNVTPAGEKPQRPEGIPEKFWDAEKGQVRVDDLAKSYVELEKNRGKPADAPADDKPKDTPKETPEDKKDTPDAAKAPTPELQPFFDEFAKDGKLSDESYKALEAKGISRAMVDQFAAGAQAQAAADEAAIMETIGGKDNYTKMVEWARAGLKADEAAAFNKVVEAGDVSAIKLAVQGLYAKFTAAEGESPKLIRGGSPEGVKPFDSMAQVTAAMNDPRYKADPAFRDEVVARMRVSSIL